MKKHSGFFAAAALALAPALAHAQVYGLLKDAPASYFNDADVQLFKAAVDRALEQGVPNQAIPWENPKTRHRGDVTVMREFESKQRPCKLVRVRNNANGVKSNVRVDMCSIEGQWKIVPKADL